MHNFQTGIFKNKKNPDFLDFCRNPSDAHLNFLHELASQHLGHSPSHFWGYQVMPWRFQGVPNEVLHYVRDATRQPKHEFQRRMLDNTDLAKRASGWIRTVGRTISDAAETAGSVALKASNFLRKHQSVIDNASHIANTGASIAVLSGLITPKTADKIQRITKIVSKPKKKGKGWEDFK